MSEESKNGEIDLLDPDQTRNSREALPQRPDRWTWLGLLIVVGLYATSLCLPVIEIMGESIMGWQAFWLVPRAFLTGEFNEGATFKDKAFGALTWLPNPLLWTALILWLKRSWRGAAIFAAHATWISLLYAIDLETATFHVNHFYPGYFLWVASAAILMIFSVIRAIAARNAGHLRCESSTLHD